ncbi:MAG: hypothetical protein KA715_05575 [Xanthomonadaceae bacterium]|nr:hypothetical protein [Xanthomonadaceae bacterium]
MAHYIYFFSKFTDEAIVFEVFAFFLLVAILTAYYILSKRFMRESDKLIPLSALRGYLDKNIVETNEFRMALFGESLNVGELPPGQGPANYVAPSSPADQNKVVELQALLFNQQKMIEDLKVQKQQIEAQVAAGGGGTAPGAGAGGGGGNSAETEDLRARLKNAEDRLAEYSVIEDDLANLKRLHQENAKLKAQVGGSPAPQTGATAAAPAAIAPEVVAAPPPATAVPEVVEAKAPASAATAPAIEGPGKDAAPAAGSASKDGNFKDGSGLQAPGTKFETAVDQVEAALSPETAAPAISTTSTSPEAAAAEAATAAPEAKPKNDEDLLAEFEKMLGT